METLVIVSTALAAVLVIAWAVLWFRSRGQRDEHDATAPSTAGAVQRMQVDIWLPRGEQAAFIAALAQRLDHEALAGEIAITTVPATAQTDGADETRIILDARNGPQALEFALWQLRAQGYRVERTQGTEIVLSGWTATEARVGLRNGATPGADPGA